MALAVRKGSGGGTGRTGLVQYEVLLQEMLTKAGCDLSPDAPRDVKRLACHMHLFEELHRGGAFGGLTGVINMVIKEVQKSLYSDEVIANPLLGGPGGNGNMARLPFFATIHRMEQELGQIHAQAAGYQQQAANHTQVEQQLQEELQRERERAEELEGQLTRLEYEVAKARDRAASAMEEMEINHNKDRESIQYLEHQLKLAKEASKDTVDEIKMLRGREEVEVRMRSHFAGIEYEKAEETDSPRKVSMLEQSHVIITQLLTLQNGRIDDYENRLANAQNAAIPSHETPEQVKFYFAAEMNSLHKEIKDLQEYQQSTEKRELDKNLRKGPASDGQLSKVPEMRIPSTVEEETEGREGMTLDTQTTQTRMPASQAARMWHSFHVRSRGNNLLIKPQVSREIPPAELTATINRIIEANFLAMSPHVKWSNEGNRAQPRGRLHCSDDHPSVGKRQDAAQVAKRTAIPAAEFFYEYLEDRYGCHEVAMCVAHSILKGVEHDHSGNNKVAMYGKVLARDIDDALWQYAAQCEWLLHNHPRGQQWQVTTQAQFEEFWGLLYPQLSEAELSQAFKEVTNGHGAHVLSNDLVIDYCIGKLLQKTENRFKRWVKVLKWKDTTNKNIVHRHEVSSAAPKMFPELDPKVVDLAFCLAAQSYNSDHLPLESMAYLACHLDACTLTWTT